MESTLTDQQTLIAFIVAFSTIAAFFAFMWVWVKWFPATKRTRLCKKFKGQLSFYRPEVWRPIFGWTPFWTSKYTGSITRDGSWSSNKEDCLKDIETFKLLKNITVIPEEYKA